MSRRPTVACRRCGRIEVRPTPDTLPRGWAAAVVQMGAVAQQIVYVCRTCPVPTGTLNRHPGAPSA